MTYNFHAHTYLCSHASGTPEEYILRAIEGGIRYMGFSDHAPYICSDGYEASFRVPTQKVQEYFSMLYALREKYKDKIDIKIGFEMEYYPDKFRDMLKSVIGYGAEYLILGEHFMDEEHPNGIHSSRKTDSAELLDRYVSCVVSAIKSGAFTYIAHPDMFNFAGDTALYREKMTELCAASREYGIPLEINCLGIRDNRHYPNEAFWKIAGEEKAPVTFGFDAHDVPSAFDGESVVKAKKMVEKYALNYIGMPEIRLIQKLEL